MNVKSILSLALVLMSTLAFAQNSNLKRGKTSYSKYSDLKSIGNTSLGLNDLKNSLTVLEKAIVHEKTSGLAETWTYYALANADYAAIDTTEAASQYAQKAIDAKAKAATLEGAAEQKENLEEVNSILAQYELNQGIAAWNKDDFEKAYQAFDRGSAYLPNDTTLLHYAGLAAINSGDFKKTLAKYVLLLKREDFSAHPQIVLDASKIYFTEGDTINAIKTAEYGYKKYPDSANLATQFIELNMMAGKEKEVITIIKEQLQKEPNNKAFYYYLGLAYNDSKDLEQAEAAYKKSIEIDPEYIESYINLGGLILNKGIDIYNAANNNRELSEKDYDAEIAKAHVIFDQALPYLQKAVDLDNKNIIALENLLNYYQIKQNVEKTKEVRDLINALQ